MSTCFNSMKRESYAHSGGNNEAKPLRRVSVIGRSEALLSSTRLTFVLGTLNGYE